MRQKVNVLLIEDSPDYAQLVHIWLAAKEDVAFSLNWTDTLAAGLSRVTHGDIDLVLLDLGLPDSEGFQTFLRVKMQAPETPIIVLSAADNEALALQTVQAGAQDYLVKSASNGDALVRAAQYALVRHSKQRDAAGQETGSGAKLIGLLGSCGGVGTTTLACHLAYELSDQAKQRVLLADLGMTGGGVAFLTQASSPYSIRDATANLHRLDDECWNQMICAGNDALHVLLSPASAIEIHPAAADIMAVLATASYKYDWIVADLGRLDPISGHLCSHMNELLVVTTAELPALYQTKRLVEELSVSGIDREKLRLVSNQAAPGTEVTNREIEKIFGLPVYARLPNDRLGLREAHLNGRLLADTSPLRLRIRDLARKMAGLGEIEEQKPRRWMSLSVLGGRRRGSEVAGAESIKDLVRF